MQNVRKEEIKNIILEINQKAKIIRLYKEYKEKALSSRLSYVRNYFNRYKINLKVITMDQIE